MALGPQFDNTYWHDKEGRVQTSVTDRRRELDATMSRLDLSPRKRPNQAFLTTETHEDLTDDETRFVMEESGNSPVAGSDRYALQGMLFSPHVGTEQKDDPLVPMSRRTAAADRALGLDRPSSRRKRGHAELLRDTLVNTGLSTSEIESIRPVNAQIIPDKGMFEGSFQSLTRQLNVARHNRIRVETVEPKTVETTLPSDTPIFNEKFGEQFRSKVNAPELFDNDVLNRMAAGTRIHWHNPETGETASTIEELNHLNREYGPTLMVPTEGSRWDYHEYGSREEDRSKPIDWENEDSWTVRKGSSRTPGIETLVDRGFIPNLFFGKGVAAENKKVHSEPAFKAERDYPFNDRGIYPAVDVHTRHVPGGVETTTIPGRKIKHREPYLSAETMTHELGHATDDADDRIGGVKYTSRARVDPMSEGRSDGVSDRYSTDRLVEAMGDVELTSKDITKKGPYATDLPYRNQWTNNTQKALYAGTRAHARLHGLQSQHTSRETVMATLRKSPGWDDTALNSDSDIDTMTLGHMWEHYPHIREHVEAAGLGETAMNAHAKYLEVSGTRPHEEGEAEAAYLNAMEDKSIRPFDRPRSQPKQKETLF